MIENLKKKNEQATNITSKVVPAKVVRTLANSIFQNLREEGFENKDIIGVSSQLIGMVTSALEEEHPKKK